MKNGCSFFPVHMCMLDSLTKVAVLVRAFSEEGKVDEAVIAVREMERRGVVGAACVYYELACCLCNKGRWQDAIIEVHSLSIILNPVSISILLVFMVVDLEKYLASIDI